MKFACVKVSCLLIKAKIVHLLTSLVAGWLVAGISRRHNPLAAPRRKRHHVGDIVWSAAAVILLPWLPHHADLD